MLYGPAFSRHRTFFKKEVFCLKSINEGKIATKHSLSDKDLYKHKKLTLDLSDTIWNLNILLQKYHVR